MPPGCRSVIALARRFNPSTLNARSTSPYTVTRNALSAAMDRLARELAGAMDALGGPGAAIIVGELPEVPIEQVREAADWLRTEAKSAVVCLAVCSDGKPMLIAAMTDDLVKKGLKAGELIQNIVPAIDGRGGGKPNLAQAGGNKAEGIPQALALATEWIRKKLA